MRSASRTPRDSWADKTTWQGEWQQWKGDESWKWTSGSWGSWPSSSWRWKVEMVNFLSADEMDKADARYQTWDKTWQQEETTDEAEAPAVPEPWYVDAHDLTLQPSGQHNFTMILLHSCSGGPDDWIPIIHRLQVPFRNEIRFVIPSAPLRRESHNSWRGEMNSWFEYSEDGNNAKDPQEVVEQVQRIQQLMQEEVNALPGQDPKRLLLGGFSQGVAVVIEAALSFETKTSPLILLRGAALSTGSSATEEELCHMQVLAHHGRWDRLCSAESAMESYRQRLLGAQLRLVVDETLGHACARGRQQLCAGEFQQICDFLRDVWGPMAADSSCDSSA